MESKTTTQELITDIENQRVNLQFNTFNDTEYKKTNKNNYSDCIACFGGISIMLLMISIVCGWIVWAIFSIIALTKTSNSEIQDKCPDSNLWILLLVLIVIGFVTNIITNIASSSNKNEEKEKNIKNNLFTTLVSIGLLVWCGIELFSSCARNNLSNSTIYLLVEINFWTGISVFGLLTCCIPCMFCVAGFN